MVCAPQRDRDRRFSYMKFHINRGTLRNHYSVNDYKIGIYNFPKLSVQSQGAFYSCLLANRLFRSCERNLLNLTRESSAMHTYRREGHCWSEKSSHTHTAYTHTQRAKPDTYNLQRRNGSGAKEFTLSVP